MTTIDNEALGTVSGAGKPEHSANVDHYAGCIAWARKQSDDAVKQAVEAECARTFVGSNWLNFTKKPEAGMEPPTAPTGG